MAKNVLYATMKTNRSQSFFYQTLRTVSNMAAKRESIDKRES